MRDREENKKAGNQIDYLLLNQLNHNYQIPPQLVEYW